MKKSKSETMMEEGVSAPVRLQKVLASAGVDSRRHCEELIVTGRVTVDGEVVKELGVKVDPFRQDVRLDGEKISVQRRVYYALNKPTGFLCTNRDPRRRNLALDLFPSGGKRLFSVGRLDENSQGLLLVTNDGELAHRLAHPRFRVSKVYVAHVAGVPTRETLGQLKGGLQFTEGRFKVDDVRLLRTKGDSALLELTLTEGQNREIRRLLARIGHKVLRLERTALGPVQLGTLPLGRYRPLTPEELRELKALVSGQRSRGKPSAGRREFGEGGGAAGANRGGARRNRKREVTRSESGENKGRRRGARRPR